MTIAFKAKTNYHRPFLNYAVFNLDGKTVLIDRDATYFTYDDGIMDVDWEGLYIWDSEKANYDIPKDFCDRAKFIMFEVEDDAPEDYYFELVDIQCYD